MSEHGAHWGWDQCIEQGHEPQTAAGSAQSFPWSEQDELQQVREHPALGRFYKILAAAFLSHGFIFSITDLSISP